MTTIKIRRATAALWTVHNPVLASGEPGFETDTGKQKIGNGTSDWISLEYSKYDPRVDALLDALGVGFEGDASDLSTRLDDAVFAPVSVGSLDFPSIAAGAQAELTLSCPGSLAGGTVLLGAPSNIPAGITWQGYVATNDVVTIRLTNTTGSSIDPPSGSWRASVAI